MSMTRQLIRALLCLGIAGVVGNAGAAIKVMGTRVIYPEAKREVTINLVNTEDAPRLVQAWVDSGDVSQSATSADAPFIVTPPITRIERGKSQALRLMFTGEALPGDREAVYWLNILEIPPRPNGESAEKSNHLQFAIRTRIKIFYRPKGLSGTPAEAHKGVAWRLLGSAGNHQIECTNSSSYNVSFSAISQAEGAKVIVNGGMCPAKGSQRFPIKPAFQNEQQLQISVVNDYGGIDIRELHLVN